jgi:glutamate-1-semialdehyde 2,1-aminomutase
MAAGLATLELLAAPGAWDRAAQWAEHAATALQRAAAEAGVPLTVQRVGTMLTPFFTANPVKDYAAARATDRAAFTTFFHAMLDAGIYLPPSPFEAAFTSMVHGPTELEDFEAAARTVFRQCRR